MPRELSVVATGALLVGGGGFTLFTGGFSGRGG